MCTRNSISIKRIFVGVAVGMGIVAVAAAWILFPSAPTRVLANTAAIVAQSWNDTFGGPPDEQVSEIDLGSDDTSSSSPDFAAPVPEALVPEAPASPTVIFDTGTSAAENGAQSDAMSGIVQNGAASGSDPTVTGVPVATGTPAVAEPPAPAECTVALSAPLSRKLVWNEIAWMGSPQLIGESGLAASGREWMELKNISGAALDISGWQVLDAKGNIRIVFGAGTIVPAGGLVLLEHGDAVPWVLADVTYSGALSNAGAALAIVDAACNASDILDASSGWPAGNNETKQTLERDADGLGWHTSVAPGGTPKAENSVPVAQIATITTATATTATVAAAGTSGSAVTIADATTTTGAGTNSNTNASTGTNADTNAGATTTTATITAASSTDVGTNASANVNTSTTVVSTTAASHLVIAAVQIAGAVSTNDFVKIFNPTASAVDVSGWKLRKKSKSGTDYSLRVFPNGSSVPSRGYFMWANSENGFGDSVAANATSTATLAADNSVALLDAKGTIIDAVAWGEGTGQYAEGVAYQTNPEVNQVLERKSALDGTLIDTDNNANDFFVVP